MPSDRPRSPAARHQMIDRVEERFGFVRRAWPRTVPTDWPICSARLVDERGIEPHIPVFDKLVRTDGTFECADFTYDQKRATYTSVRQARC